MNQMIRILRKDIRLLWIEIGLSLAALVGFTVWEPRTWTSTVPFNIQSQRPVSQTFLFLLYVAWFLLIVRVVHLERPAGRNQFWTTRPYEWWQLMAAKLVFLELFLPVPLAVVQMVLLHQAHLPVVSNLGLILLNAVKFNGCFVLPLAFVAAVTSSFVQTLLVFVGITLMFVLESSVSWIVQGKLTLEPWFMTPLLGGVCAVLLGAALVMLYSLRRRWVSVCLAVGGPVLSLLLYVLFGGSSAALAPYGSDVADSQGNPAVVIQFDTDAWRKGQPGWAPGSGSGVQVVLPLLLEPFEGGALNVDGRRFTFTNAQGYIWQSPWLGHPLGTSYYTYTGSQGSGIIAGINPHHLREAVDVPQKVYERLGDGPVMVRVELAAEQIQKDAPIWRTLSMVPQEIPGVGVCTERPNHGTMICLAAFRTALIRVPANFKKPCGDDKGIFWQSVYNDSEPAGWAVSPIRRGWMNFGGCEDDVRFDVFRSRRKILIQTPPVTIALKDYTHTN